MNQIRDIQLSSISQSWSHRQGMLRALGLALFLLLILEWHSPKYFLQNDNLEYVLPAFSHNLSAIEQGRLPEYEYFQFTGIPHLSSGQAAVLYPVSTFSVWLSRLISGRVDFAIDLYAAIHLLAGATAGYLLLAELGLPAGIATWGALSWIFCPYVMILGRTWIAVVVWAAWFPAILYLCLRFGRQPKLASMLALSVARVLLCYAGHSQFFLLTCIFEVIVVALALGLARPRLNWRIGMLYGSGWCLTGLLALPFLLPVSHQVALSQLRSEPMTLEVMASLGMNALSFAWGHLIPFYNPGVTKDVPMVQTILFISHLSWPALIGVFLGLRQMIPGRGPTRRMLIFCAFMAAFSYCWSANLFLDLFAHLPVLNRFRWSFKLQFFTSFFMVVLAAVAFSKLSSPTWCRTLFAATFANFLWFYLLIPPRSWGLDDQPIALANPYPQIDTNYRTMTLGYSMGNLPSLPGLGWGYPLLFEVPHLAGYEPLASKDRSAVAGGELHTGSFKPVPGESDWHHFEDWAVRYFVVKQARSDIQKALLDKGYREAGRAPTSILFENQSSRTLGTLSGHRAAPVRIDGNTLNVHSGEGRLRLAFVQDSFHRAVVDGKPFEFVSSPGQAMQLQIPAGQHEIKIEYANPLLRQGALIAALGSTILLLLLRWFKLENAEALDV